MIEFEKIYNQYFKDVYKFVSHVKFTDGYQVNREKFTMDEYGDFYVTPYRPIIKSKAISRDGLNGAYRQFDEVIKSFYKGEYGEGAEIKKLYLGSTKDNILIWEQGMEVPAASDKVEEMLCREYLSNG